MDTINYLVFDVSIEKYGDHYRTYVRSPIGEAKHLFNMPDLQVDLLALDNARLRQVSSERGIRTGYKISPRGAGQKVGEILFRAAFGGDVQACLKASLHHMREKRAGLRIQMRFIDVPELAGWPWEYLFGDNDFYALSTHTPIIRYLDATHQAESLAVALPLRILAVISSPKDQMQLNTQLEWENLNHSLHSLQQRGMVILDRLETATVDSLRRKLDYYNYHILHFIGHGGTSSEGGFLLFEDEEGRSHRIDSHEVGILVRDHETMRVVFLNACHAGSDHENGPIASVAQNLIYKGIPAVVAMQSEITDQAAIAFSGRFYDAVAHGRPIDMAVSEARKAVLFNGNKLEWATPILYLRSPDGRLFDIELISSIPPISPPPPDPISVSDEIHLVRQVEIEALNLARDVKREGKTIVIKGDAQMGKSTLLGRIVSVAERAGREVAYIDFQSFGREMFNDAELFYHQLCRTIAREVRLEDHIAKYDRVKGDTPTRRCTEFTHRILQTLNKPTMIAMDEVDRFFDAKFRSDFFSMLRGWHHYRGISRPDASWTNLDIVFCTQCELHQLMDAGRGENTVYPGSPFNVVKDKILELWDCTDDEIMAFNSAYSSPRSLDDIEQIKKMVGRHPQLVALVFRLLRDGAISSESLGNPSAYYRQGEFRHYLEFLYSRIESDLPTILGLQQILSKHRCTDQDVRRRLERLGIVHTMGTEVVPRCLLYEMYFREKLNA